eukprot:COSAG04_NODE_562_length_12576_cov_154.338703_6_plen_199_part_00
MLLNAIAAIVILVFVVFMIWKVSAVQLLDTTTMSEVDDAETSDEESDRKDAASAAAQAAIKEAKNINNNVDSGSGQQAARISNTAIVSSIAFPAIFQISITFEMPFGFPPVLVQFAEWVTSIVSLDLGQVGSPECLMPVGNHSGHGDNLQRNLGLGAEQQGWVSQLNNRTNDEVVVLVKTLATVRTLRQTLEVQRLKD